MHIYCKLRLSNWMFRSPSEIKALQSSTSSSWSQLRDMKSLDATLRLSSPMVQMSEASRPLLPGIQRTKPSLFTPRP